MTKTKENIITIMIFIIIFALFIIYCRITEYVDYNAFPTGYLTYPPSAP
jgi:hypothetical protein